MFYQPRFYLKRRDPISLTFNHHLRKECNMNNGFLLFSSSPKKISNFRSSDPQLFGQRGCNKTTALGAYCSASNRETSEMRWQDGKMPGGSPGGLTWLLWNQREMAVSKKQGYPKMDGENNGKPYENSWFGGTIIFGNTQMAGTGWSGCKHQFFALQDGRTRLLYRILQGGRGCLKLVSRQAILPSRDLT